MPALPVARPDSAGKGADMSDPIERLRRKAQNETTALALNKLLHLAGDEIDLLRAERDALVKEDEIKAGVNRALLAEIERLRAACVGYSQQTVNALSSERDRLRAALIAAMEIVQRERVRTVEKAKNGASPNILNWLDAVIAQADAALK